MNRLALKPSAVQCRQLRMVAGPCIDGMALERTPLRRISRRSAVTDAQRGLWAEYALQVRHRT